MSHERRALVVAAPSLRLLRPARKGDRLRRPFLAAGHPFGQARQAGRVAFRLQGGAGKMNEPLPALVDAKQLQRELGVTRSASEAIMRQVATVQIPGLRKVFVRRSDVARLLEASTFGKDQVPV
jgi:hypothetical protein